MYQIRLSRRAEKDLAGIPPDHRVRIERALWRFAEHPELAHDVVKVRDSPKVVPRYRILIGEYRATFLICHDILLVEIITIGNQKNSEYLPAVHLSCRCVHQESPDPYTGAGFKDSVAQAFSGEAPASNIDFTETAIFYCLVPDVRLKNKKKRKVGTN